jgi:CheY-like chemotaxis protein
MQKYNCVLLVDDDHVSSFLIKEILKTSKVAQQIYSTENGEQALRFIETHENKSSCPDLIFLDINMPVMDGFQFLEEFQKLSERVRKTIKIIVLTSSSNSQDRRKANEYPIYGYLTKPLTFKTLEQILPES